jgi:hypothetical protein
VGHWSKLTSLARLKHCVLQEGTVVADLNNAHLRDYLKRLPEFEDIEAEERAMATALGFPEIHQALAFLISWPKLEKAAALVLGRVRELNGPVTCRGCARRKTSARDHPAFALDDRFCFETKQGETIPARRPPPRRMCEPRKSYR